MSARAIPAHRALAALQLPEPRTLDPGLEEALQVLASELERWPPDALTDHNRAITVVPSDHDLWKARWTTVYNAYTCVWDAYKDEHLDALKAKVIPLATRVHAMSTLHKYASSAPCHMSLTADEGKESRAAVLLQFIRAHFRSSGLRIRVDSDVGYRINHSNFVYPRVPSVTGFAWDGIALERYHTDTTLANKSVVEACIDIIKRDPANQYTVTVSKGVVAFNNCVVHLGVPALVLNGSDAIVCRVEMSQRDRDTINSVIARRTVPMFHLDADITEDSVVGDDPIDAPTLELIIRSQYPLLLESPADLAAITEDICGLMGRLFFSTDNDDWQTLLWLYGNPRTGKSLLVEHIRNYYHPDDVGIVGVMQHTFGVSELCNKLLIVAPELRPDTNLNISFVLSACCPHEAITAPVKFKSPIRTTITSPIVVASNFPASSVFQNAGNIRALARRLVAVPFNHTVDDLCVQTDLAQRLRDEKAAVLLKLCASYRRMLREAPNTPHTRLCPTLRREHENTIVNLDPVRHFIERSNEVSCLCPRCRELLRRELPTRTNRSTIDDIADAWPDGFRVGLDELENRFRRWTFLQHYKPVKFVYDTYSTAFSVHRLEVKKVQTTRVVQGLALNQYQDDSTVVVDTSGNAYVLPLPSSAC